ncbi:MAG: hypothetical protein BYD32DRAFT_461729 [Podila humilis]|nr:MAG: hypothetical protein BYD32DRAFT_461729 [Podila humilis]
MSEPQPHTNSSDTQHDLPETPAPGTQIPFTPMGMQSFVDEVRASHAKYDKQFELLISGMDSLKRAINSLTSAHAADHGLFSSANTGEVVPPSSRSENAFRRSTHQARNGQSGSPPGPNQQNQQNRQAPSGTGRSEYEYQTIDPRLPLNKRGIKTREYRTKFWHIQDNLDFTGQTGIRTADAILAQSKKVRCYSGKSLAGNSVDEWIDSFERWHSANIGNPYTPGLDHEVLRLFASACDPIPALAKAFDNYIEFSPSTPTWPNAVHRLHMVLTTQQEREAQTKETVLENCVQGTKGIIEYNNLFNHTLYTMQRHGYDMLACRADHVVLLYTRNLRAQFRMRLNTMVDIGLNYDTHESAYHNIHAIQCYMEYQGDLDQRNHIEDLHHIADQPQASGSNTSGTSSTFLTPEPILSTPTDPSNAVSDTEMMDLVRSLDHLNLTDSQRLGVFRTMMKSKNQTHAAGAPVVNLAHASDLPPPTLPPIGPFPSLNSSSSEPRSPAPPRIPITPYVKDYSTYRCRLCGIMGHIALVCPSKAQKLICTNCEEKGHYSELCPRDPGPRVMWMLRQDDYNNGTPRPFFEENEEDFTETDYNLWDRERQIYQIKWEQYQDFCRGNLPATLPRSDNGPPSSRLRHNNTNKDIHQDLPLVSPPAPRASPPVSNTPVPVPWPVTAHRDLPSKPRMEGVIDTAVTDLVPGPTGRLPPPAPPPPRMIASHVEVPPFRHADAELKQLEVWYGASALPSKLSFTSAPSIHAFTETGAHSPASCKKIGSPTARTIYYSSKFLVCMLTA